MAIFLVEEVVLAVVAIEWLLLTKPGVYAITKKSEEVAAQEGELAEKQRSEARKEVVGIEERKRNDPRNERAGSISDVMSACNTSGSLG